MENKKQTKSNFFKRNIYYFVIAFILISAIAVTVILFLSGNNGVIQLENSILNSSDKTAEIPQDTSPKDSGNFEPIQKPNDGQTPDAEPTQKPMTFIMPVDNATVICDYTATSVVYNKTLGIYTGHLAIDFSASQGAEVKVVFDGKIESIVTSYLTGTTITGTHENNAKTV